MTWRKSVAARGGGEGSRLMMLAFCCSIQQSLTDADKLCKLAMTARAQEQSKHVTPRHIGYQDDQYFGGTLKAFLIYEPFLLEVRSTGQFLLRVACF